MWEWGLEGFVKKNALSLSNPKIKYNYYKLWMSFQRKQQKTINSQKVLLRCNLVKFFYFYLGVQYSIW